MTTGIFAHCAHLQAAILKIKVGLMSTSDWRIQAIVSIRKCATNFKHALFSGNRSLVVVCVIITVHFAIHKEAFESGQPIINQLLTVVIVIRDLVPLITARWMNRKTKTG